MHPAEFSTRVAIGVRGLLGLQLTHSDSVSFASRKLRSYWWRPKTFTRNLYLKKLLIWTLGTLERTLQAPWRPTEPGTGSGVPLGWILGRVRFVSELSSQEMYCCTHFAFGRKQTCLPPLVVNLWKRDTDKWIPRPLISWEEAEDGAVPWWVFSPSHTSGPVRSSPILAFLPSVSLETTISGALLAKAISTNLICSLHCYGDM